MVLPLELTLALVVASLRFKEPTPSVVTTWQLYRRVYPRWSAPNELEGAVLE